MSHMAGTHGKKIVELFYDVVSPYTWFAFETLCRYRTVWPSMELRLRPFFLGGIMQGAGNEPPASRSAAKAAYLAKDLERSRHYFDVPMHHPADPVEVMFVKGSLKAQRLITAVRMVEPGFTEAISRELWMRIWSRDEDIVEPGSLLEAAKKAGIDDTLARKLVDELIHSKPVKKKLKDTTQEALDHGAFGSPTIIAHTNGGTQMFFGSDRFALLAEAIGEKWLGPKPDSSIMSDSKL